LTTTINGGAGFLYGEGAANANKDEIVTTFVPVNDSSGSQLPVIDAATGILTYIKRAASQTDTIDRVLGFKSDGTLVSTDKFVNSISFTDISGLTFAVASGAGTLTATNTTPVTFPLIRSSVGTYFGPSSSLGLVMADSGTEGSSEFTFATSDSLPSTWTSNSYLTLLRLAGHTLTTSGSYTAFTTTETEIKTRFLGSSIWRNLSTNICMPTSFLIGRGPLASTATIGEGMLLRSDTTDNSLTFTNYNLSATGSKSIAKDRSCRLGLEVLDVDTGSDAYANTKNTAYLTHTYVPRSGTSITVDQFVIPNSNRSYKYLVHAETEAGEFYTTELLVQVKGSSTVNLIQYASSTTSSSLSVTYSASISGDNVVISYGSASPGSLDIKLIKYEV